MRRAVLACAILLTSCGEPAEPPADAPKAAAPTPEAAAPSDLIARGTEPFWAVEIKPSGLKLMRPDHPDLVQPNPGPTTDGPKVIWQTPAYRLAVEVKPCSDGMSDLRYPFAAEISLADGVTMTGCAGKDERPSPAP
jgi:uncharacterized membrane protein